VGEREYEGIRIVGDIRRRHEFGISSIRLALLPFGAVKVRESVDGDVKAGVNEGV
jgi:hypothetical protein